MDPFQGRTAVITGGGSGIGAETARAFAKLGARIVLADLDEEGMRSVAEEVASLGSEAHTVRTDVSRLEDVRHLADEAFGRFGKVHLLFNNAGVGVFGPLAEATHQDWVWLTNVNYWGVVHGIEAFLARMIAQGEGGHVINTASMAGLTGMAGLGVYCATKFAVVGLTESLSRELRGTGIGASVLCPMIVRTRIDSSERNRPEELRNPGHEVTLESAQYTEQRAIDVGEVSKRIVEAVRDADLYILTHHEQQEILERRAERLRRAAAKYATA